MAGWRDRARNVQGTSGNSSDWRSRARNVETEKPKERSLADYGKEGLRQLGRTGRFVATGISGLADIPNLAAVPLHMAGLKEKPYFYEPVAGHVQGGIDALTGGKLKPRNKEEEWMDWIGESAAPLALAPLTGGASLTGTVARTAAKQLPKGLAKKSAEKIAQFGSQAYAPTAQNIGGNLGASVASKNYMDSLQPGEDPSLLGTLGAGFVGGGLGGSTARGLKALPKLAHPIDNVKNAAAARYGKWKDFSPEKYAEYENLGINPTLGAVSNSPKTLNREMALSNSAYGRGAFNKYHDRLGKELGQNLGSLDPEDPKRAIDLIDKGLAKKGTAAYKKHQSDEYGKRASIFEPRVQQALKNRELVDVSDVLKDLKKEYPGLETTAEKKLFAETTPGGYFNEIKELSRQEKELRRSIRNIDSTDKSVLNEIDRTRKDLMKKGVRNEDALESQLRKMYPEYKGKPSSPSLDMDSDQISYGALDILREKALDESKTPQIASTKKRQADNIHYALSDKRHEFMETHGNPAERQNAKEARKLWSDYRKRGPNGEKSISEYVQEILKVPSESAAFEKVFSKDPKYASIVAEGFRKPEDKKLWTKTVLTYAGKDSGTFKPTTQYNKVKNWDSTLKKKFLSGFNNEEMKNFDGTMKLIGDRKEEFDRIYNTSRSAYVGKDLALDAELQRNTFKALKGNKVAMGNVIANISGRYSDKLSAKAFTDPDWLKRVNRAMLSKNEREARNNLNLLFKNKYAKTAVKGISKMTKLTGRMAPHLHEMKDKSDK